MDPLPPDPYKALGLTPTATSSEIKSAYRRAALKYHPDKAPGKAEEFHRISTAYEILGDDDKKAQYDAEIKLRKLREELAQNERLSGGGGRSNGSSAAYAGHGAGSGWTAPGVQIRTASYTYGGSKGANVTSFFNDMDAAHKTDSRRSGTRDSPVSDRSADDNTFTTSAFAFAAEIAGRYAKKYMNEHQARPSMTQRKSSRHEESDKKSGSRATKDAPSQQERERLRKMKDRAEANDRRYKHAQRASVESDDDDDMYASGRREAERRRTVAEEKTRYEETNARKRRESMAQEGGIYHERTRPLEKEVRDARDYQRQARSPLSPNPPSLSRSNTYTADAYDARRSPQAERPSMTRRTSTRQPEPRASPTKDTRYNDRRASESAEYASQHRSSSRPQPPPLNTAYTSPDLSRGAQSASTSRRTQTFDDYNSNNNSLPGQRLGRSQTMPTEPELRRSGTRRTTMNHHPERSSNLRYAEVPTNINNDSGYSTSSPSETPQPTFASPLPKQRSHDNNRDRASGNKAYVDDAYDEVRRFMGEPIPSRPSLSRQPSTSRNTAVPPRKSPERERERERERPERPTINTTGPHSRAAPPPSRSASYAAKYPEVSTPISPMPNSAASSRRRPSLTRSDSLRMNSTSTRATSYDVKSPSTPLKTSGFSSYFDEPIAASPVDYTLRDAFASSSRGKENVKRFSYAPSGYGEAVEVPIREARPSGPGRRDSINGGSMRGGGGGGERRAGPPSAYGGGYDEKPRNRRGSVTGGYW